jgi:hypothetical protein
MLFITLASRAQINKGSFLLGGSFTYGQVKVEEEPSSGNSTGKVNVFEFDPQFGIAIKENLVTGIFFQYLTGKSDNLPGIGTVESDGFGAGVFARKFFPVATRFYVFAESGLGYASKKYSQSWPNLTSTHYDHRNSSIVLNIYPGVSYNLTKSFYLDAAFPGLLNITWSKEETKDNGTAYPVQTREREELAIQAIATNTTMISVGFRFILN